MFLPLSRVDVKKIVKLQLKGIESLLDQQNIKVIFEEHIVDKLADLGYDPQYGARPVKRVIQKEVLNELSKQLLIGSVKKGDEVVLDEFDGKFVFRKPLSSAQKI